MKGAGGLSRKLLTILAMAVIPLSGIAVAQNATGPNNVYIEQVGSSNTITIEQVGGGNNVGGTGGGFTVSSTNVTTLIPTAPSATNYGTITGNFNVLNLNQFGDSNSAQYNIKGNNNLYTSTITGNANQTNLQIGDLTSGNNLRNTVIETILGNTNTVMQPVVGSDIASTLDISGNNNQVTNELLSSRGSVTNTIAGDFNVFKSQQSDSAGANGHVLVMNTLGDYNSMVTQQQGFNDTSINISTVGSHNTITVRTSSSSIAGPLTAIAR